VRKYLRITAVGGRYTAVGLIAAVAACVACLSIALGTAGASAVSPRARVAEQHFACSGPNSAHVACHFATPNGNIRCLWTPKPDNVACERVAFRRGFRLDPTGKAKPISLNLKRRGETLPTDQQVVFPHSLSCRDTKTTMICNQDFGFGEFKLGPKLSHGA
jgi:hypothetical protein